MIFYNKKEPAIYLRYCNNVVMYIGETQDWKRGRPFREGDEPKYKDKELIDLVEEEIKETFPMARLIVLSSDTMNNNKF